MRMILAFLLIGSAAAQNHAVLPQPQKVRYGAGKFLLKSAAVHLAGTPQATDRFAAAELAKALRIPQNATGAHAITLRRTGDLDPLPRPGDQPGPDSREAYTIHITPTAIDIAARTSAGLYYGTITLAQMVESRGDRAYIPEAEIQDWPALAYRGFMMDMSHAQFPTEDEVKGQLDFLARWKVNQYFFYSEASIELEGYPLLQPEGRFTQDQVRRIVAYARDRHIDVVPCLELYGHLHDLFKLEHFRDLAPLPHGGEFDPRRPETKQLLENWTGQLARLFPSPFVHIGFDETWTLDQAVKKQGNAGEAAQLFLGQFQTVAGMFQKHGKRIMAWSDMIVKFPEIIPKLPQGTIAFPWNYEPLKDYGPMLAPFEKAGVPTIVSTAVLNYNWVVPSFDRSFENIDKFLAAGKRAKTLGVLNTGWTDETVNLMRMSRPGIAYGAVAGWQSEPIDHARFYATYARLISPAAAAELGAGLEKLSKASTLLEKAVGATAPALWADPLSPERLARAQQHASDLHEARLAAEDAQIQFRNAMTKDRELEALRTYQVGAQMIDYTSLRYIYATEIASFWKQLGDNPTREEVFTYVHMEIDAKYHTRTADMLEFSTTLQEKFRQAWLDEYTPYRLGIVMGKWNAEFQYWLSLQRHIQQATSTFKSGDKLPPLDSLRPRL